MTTIEQNIIAVPPMPPSRIPLIVPSGTAWKQPETYPIVAVRRALGQMAQSIASQYGIDRLEVLEPPPTIPADFAIPCHPLAKAIHQPPNRIAEDLIKQMDGSFGLPFIQSVVPDRGYLNITLNLPAYGDRIVRDIEEMEGSYGQQDVGLGRTIVIDCSSPNVAKYMSVGHLRSTVIGESLARTCRAMGYTVIRDNHIGDWGTQFGMLGRAYELWKDEIPEIRDGTDPVKGLYLLYVRMHEAIEEEKAQDPSGESSLEREGRDWFRRLEAGDPEAFSLLTWATQSSLAEFQRVYDLLGVDFEYILGESYFIPMVPSLVEALCQQGLAHEDARGALIVPLDEEGLERLVVRKSDGASLYATRDLATLLARASWFQPDRILYVVGQDQSDYFQQVFAAYRKWIGTATPQLEHVAFGMISLPEGKMSTRRGRVVFLEEVLEEAIRRARQRISDTRDFSAEEIETVARQVGCGAVIYMDLGQGRERSIQFDWDRALALEGNTAPYIQYAHARARSVMRRAAEEGIDIDSAVAMTFGHETEQALVRHLGKFPLVIDRAFRESQPSVVAEYVHTCASLFSQFYKQLSILQEPDTIQRQSRLRLTAATAQVIRNGLALLGIDAPERM